MHAPFPRLAVRGRRSWAWPLFSLCLLGCDGQSSKDLPVWSPSDHDNQSNPGADQTDTTAARPRMPELNEHGIDDVVLATWKQNCTTCHGLVGRGDGPQAPMFRPPDLTSAAFQARAIDSEILYAIEKGRGRMPAFGHLPKDTIAGLARLVRMLGPAPGDVPPASSAGAASSATPAASAAAAPGPAPAPPAGHGAPPHP